MSVTVRVPHKHGRSILHSLEKGKIIKENLPLGVVIICTFDFFVSFSLLLFGVEEELCSGVGHGSKKWYTHVICFQTQTAKAFSRGCLGLCKKQKDEATLSLPSNISV